MPSLSNAVSECHNHILFPQIFLYPEGRQLLFRSYPVAVSHNLQRIHSFTAFISLLINLTFMIDPYFKPCGKCIYYRRTYSVKTTGYLVPSASKFTAGMKNGKYYFYSRNPCFMIDSYRNTTSVIYNCDRVVRINDYLNLCTNPASASSTALSTIS